MISYVPAKEFEGQLWVRAADFQKAISEAECSAWQGLTDEEIGALLGPFPKYASEWGYVDFYQFARAIEAKFKEKNT